MIDRTYVIGLGNPIMMDDAFGPCVLSRLQKHALPPQVILVDCSNSRHIHIPDISAGDTVIFLDTVTAGKKPGTVSEYRYDELAPHNRHHPVSLIEFSVFNTLATYCPDINPSRMTVIGIEPESMAPGNRITDTVRSGVDDAVRLVLKKDTERSFLRRFLKTFQKHFLFSIDYTYFTIFKMRNRSRQIIPAGKVYDSRAQHPTNHTTQRLRKRKPSCAGN